MKVDDVLRDYMKEHGYSGLFSSGECGCDLDELHHCDEDHGACNLGYKYECEGCFETEGCMWFGDVKYCIKA